MQFIPDQGQDIAGEKKLLTELLPPLKGTNAGLNAVSFEVQKDKGVRSGSLESQMTVRSGKG